MENDNSLNLSDFINRYDFSKHNFLEEDLLFKQEINLDFLRSKDQIEMLKKDDNYDFNILKFNLSSNESNHNNLNYSNNNSNHFHTNNIHKNEFSDLDNNLNNVEPLNDNSFKNKFLKDIIIKKVENILMSDNLQEKLMLYYIISISDSNLLKEKSKQLFNDNKITNSNLQKNIVSNIINDFCKHLTRKGYSIAEQVNQVGHLSKSSKSKITKKTMTKSNKKKTETKKAWLCPHVYRENYAKGKCQNCYLSFYNKIKVKNNKSQASASNSD